MGVTDRYRLISDLPSEIPVFPLRGVILLPRTTLPLNIFEPRYLAMVDAAMAGHRLIGIVQPETDGDQTESPVGKAVGVRRLGCAGRITTYSELDDGRMLITLTGVCRFGLGVERTSTTPFRVFTVDYAGHATDLVRGAGEDAVDREHLLSVLKEYLAANNLRADWQAINRSSNEFLVNTLSMISPYGSEEKQALLEADTLKTRAEVLVALAEMDMASHNDGSGSTLQ